MAVAYRTISAQANNGGTGTLTLTEPSGATQGDLFVACIAHRGTVDPIGLPTGWTLIQSVFVSNVATNNTARPSLKMAWIQRGGSSPSFAFTGFDNVATGFVIRLDGHDTLSPIDVSTSLLSDSLVTTHNTGSIIPTRNDGLWIGMACAGVEGTNGTAWSSHNLRVGPNNVDNAMTEIADFSTTLGADVDIAIAYIAYASIATGPLQESRYESTHDRSSRSSLGLVAIKPPAAGAATSRSFAVIC